MWQALAPGDLLPVVCNPIAKIAPSSKLKTIGKTPSRYNQQGEVVGIPGWSDHVNTPAEVGRWLRVPDYGICLITRRFRAVDIDVPDVRLADSIEDAVVRLIREFLQEGERVYCRYRTNSGKRLLLFHSDGDIAKSTLTFTGGLVELLMTGQQCVVAGTHQSGTRYQWRVARGFEDQRDADITDWI